MPSIRDNKIREGDSYVHRISALVRRQSVDTDCIQIVANVLPGWTIVCSSVITILIGSLEPLIPGCP